MIHHAPTDALERHWYSSRKAILASRPFSCRTSCWRMVDHPPHSCCRGRSTGGRQSQSHS
jgi:hypothetical protein